VYGDLAAPVGSVPWRSWRWASARPALLPPNAPRYPAEWKCPAPRP
jgi:hypothetical protein